MECNMGRVDRKIRVIAGILLVAVGISLPKWWVMGLGLLVLITAYVAFCPVYWPLNISTLEKQEAPAKVASKKPAKRKK